MGLTRTEKKKTRPYDDAHPISFRWSLSKATALDSGGEETTRRRVKHAKERAETMIARLANRRKGELVTRESGEAPVRFGSILP